MLHKAMPRVHIITDLVQIHLSFLLTTDQCKVSPRRSFVSVYVYLLQNQLVNEIDDSAKGYLKRLF